MSVSIANGGSDFLMLFTITGKDALMKDFN